MASSKRLTNYKAEAYPRNPRYAFVVFKECYVQVAILSEKSTCQKDRRPSLLSISREMCRDKRIVMKLFHFASSQDPSGLFPPGQSFERSYALPM